MKKLKKGVLAYYATSGSLPLPAYLPARKIKAYKWKNQNNTKQLEQVRIQVITICVGLHIQHLHQKSYKSPNTAKKKNKTPQKDFRVSSQIKLVL